MLPANDSPDELLICPMTGSACEKAVPQTTKSKKKNNEKECRSFIKSSPNPWRSAGPSSERGGNTGAMQQNTTF
jgi:hypothetical protein